MCGIAGVFNRDGSPVAPLDIGRMLERLVHRGPDDEGTWFGEGIGLGHRRLSIIDVTPAGHQPMATTDGDIWITYNGELYNYKEIRKSLEQLGRRFRSESDTEVILQAYQHWDTRCLEQFNGMFAFAIWDARKRRLFCARDRIGIKPLYYVLTGNRFAFASEIKALLSLPDLTAEPDKLGMLDYLAFSLVRGERTLFKGILKLLPGEFLVVDAKGVVRSTYWQVAFDESDQRTEADIVDELAWLVDDAVRIQMRADVPVGTHLSGGLDSSIVTALARRHYPGKLLSFNGRFAEGPDYDESHYARLLAQETGVELIDVLINEQDFVQALEKLVWHMDEPTAGAGLYPQYFVCKSAREHVTVALGGQGGDEIFVGYPRYRDDMSRNLLLAALRGHMNLGGYPLFDTIANVIQSGRLRSVASLWLRRLDPFPAPGATSRLLQKTARDWGLDIPDAQMLEVGEVEYSRHAQSEATPLGQLLDHDLRNYLPALLHVEDRTSMAVSLESRVPLLDHRIVELMSRVPSRVKFPRFQFKHLLRRVAEPLIPRQIIDRSDKKGFPTPLLVWVDRLHSDPGLTELRAGTSLRRTGIFKNGGSQQHVDPGWRHWAMLNLELWSRLFLEGRTLHAVHPSLQLAS